MIKDLPIYERGGKYIDDLHKNYIDSVSNENALGYKTFQDIVKLLTKRGEAKAGLSAHFIRFQYIGRVFEDMLSRLCEFQYLSTKFGNQVKGKVKKL